MSPAVGALAEDAENLAATLWLASDAAAQRGDENARRVLRGAARAAEALVDALEHLADEK